MEIILLKKIKNLCEERGIKIRDLLKSAGLSLHIIDDWESNIANPSIPALLQICKVLNITLEYLFQNDELTLTASQKKLLDQWKVLDPKEKKAIKNYIKAMQYLNEQKLK